MWRRGRGGFSDELERERRVDRGRLTGVEVRETLDVLVESSPDLRDSGLHVRLFLTAGSSTRSAWLST